MNPAEIAIVILASGRSRRFGTQDKLMADLLGQPMAMHSAKLAIAMQAHTIVATVAWDNEPLAELYSGMGIAVVNNSDADSGQGTSLALGVQHILDMPVHAVLVMLADMPFVTSGHLTSLMDCLGDGDAAASTCEGVLMPPILFARSAFNTLAALEGDKGGKAVLKTLPRIVEVEMSAHEATDIDTVEMLRGHLRS